MSYVESNLLKDESVVYKAGMHWVVFLWPIIFSIFTVYARQKNDAAMPLIGIFTLIIAIFLWVTSVVRYATSEFAVTNKRVIAKAGSLDKQSIEVLLQKVEGVRVNQSALGGLLGYGSVVIMGTGGSETPFHKIDNPQALRKAVQEQIATLEQAKVATA